MATKKNKLYNNQNIIGINQSMQQANAEFARNNNGTTLNSALTGNTYYRPPYSNTNIPNAPGNAGGGGRGNAVSNVADTSTIQDILPTYSNVTTPELTPISYTPTYGGNYDWDTGASMLSGFGNEAPTTRNVVYNNEFSPESTMSMANDIYNQYYAPMVQQQQEMNTRDYQRAANRSIESVENDRAQIQLQNQAARESTAANTLYQQQQQATAFQQTLDARNLELQNKIQDYQNAWQEVSTYGYVVTDNTANLLGIDPGQQLTTLQYKQIMSGIASSVADAEAQKVQLAQQQDELNLKVQELQQAQEQFKLSYSQTEQQLNNDLYDRLQNMLQRYDTVTPEMASLGRQVGMNLTVGDSTSNYWTTSENLQNLQNIYGPNNITGVQQASVLQQHTMIANDIQSKVAQLNTGMSTGIQNPQTFANWITPLLQAGLSTDDIMKQLKTDKKDAAGTYSFGWFNGANTRNIQNTIRAITEYYKQTYNR